MKTKEITKILNEFTFDYSIEYEFDSYTAIKINLPDGGRISTGIDKEFLYFNIRLSELRLKDSSIYNGKYNYFGNDCKEVLESLLIELHNKLCNIDIDNYKYCIVKENNKNFAKENTVFNSPYFNKKYALIEKQIQEDKTEKINKIIYSNNIEHFTELAKNYISYYNYVIGEQKDIQQYTSKI